MRKRFLEKMAEIRQAQIYQRKAFFRPKEMEEEIAHLPPPRDFLKAIRQSSPLALIAEIKRASPSAGDILEGADVRKIASAYQAGGASAISVLTEPHFFKGTLDHIRQVKEETSLPILQKDFILDPMQIYEGRLAGADAILLIAALLDRNLLQEFAELSQLLGLIPLVEVHEEKDLNKIGSLSFPLIGINNRNLKTLKVHPETTFRLMEKIPAGMPVISESGIKSREDVERLQEVGVKGVLVGEVLMRSPDPAAKIKELLGL